MTFPGPKALPLGTVQAGKSYELAPTTEAFGQQMLERKLSLVREKAK